MVLENANHKSPVGEVSAEIRSARENAGMGIFLTHLITHLRVTDTHPDCLQGSAELPVDLMQKAGLFRYQSVIAYNADRGGMSETYAALTPVGVVMTTGAMADFAPRGTHTNVASYGLGSAACRPRILRVQENCATAPAFSNECGRVTAEYSVETELSPKCATHSSK